MNLIKLNEIVNEVKKTGIYRLEKIIDASDQIKISNYLAKFKPAKKTTESIFNLSFSQFVRHFFKMRFYQISHAYFLKKLEKKLNLNYIADEIFGSKSELILIDSWFNEKSNSPVIDWHFDGAYGGEKNIKKIRAPNNTIKFIIYLTNSGIGKGGLGYIPETFKISNLLKELIYTKKIKYTPYWHLKDFRRIIEENINIFLNYLSEDELKDFFKKTEFITTSTDTNLYDAEIKAGGAVIFNDGGCHRASNTVDTERKVLRYVYSLPKIRVPVKNDYI